MLRVPPLLSRAATARLTYQHPRSAAAVSVLGPISSGFPSHAIGGIMGHARRHPPAEDHLRRNARIRRSWHPGLLRRLQVQQRQYHPGEKAYREAQAALLSLLPEESR
jgi:hypothetical protein